MSLNDVDGRHPASQPMTPPPAPATAAREKIAHYMTTHDAMEICLAAVRHAEKHDCESAGVLARNSFIEFVMPLLQEAETRATEAEKARDEYRTLSGIGTWHNDCRPNRHQAAREIAKGQSVANKLADEITTLNASLSALREAAQALQSSWGDGWISPHDCDYEFKMTAAKEKISEKAKALFALLPAPTTPQKDAHA